MSTYIEFSGTVTLTPDTPMATVVQAIRKAIGEQSQQRYFAVNNVLMPAADPTYAACIEFASIDPQGADGDTIEAAMLAIAPFVDGSNYVERVPGMNWSNAAIYRFSDGRVEVSDAELAPTGNWRSIEPQKIA